MESGLPTPPMEGNLKSAPSPTSASRRSTATTSKSGKQTHRITKRTAQRAAPSPHHDHGPLSPHALDSRHKRVWKACERCRMKKTKCDGEFPCKRCKDDGLVCTAGTRKKTEFKQLPRGYAEVLENTQLALIATVHKLYAMVRSGQPWDLGEPELNDRGQPIIHNIATKLGCIRPNADADLPPHSVFPEDEAGLAELAGELEVQQMERDVHTTEAKLETESNCNQTDRASSSELDQSDFEQDYRKAFLGSQNLQTLSPQSFTSHSDFETTALPNELDTTAAMFPMNSPTTANPFPAWNMGRTTMDLSTQYTPQLSPDMAEILLNQGLIESEFGTIKPHIVSCPNQEAMLGLGDPMIYNNYNGMESLRS